MVRIEPGSPERAAFRDPSGQGIGRVLHFRSLRTRGGRQGVPAARVGKECGEEQLQVFACRAEDCRRAGDPVRKGR